MQSDSYIAPPRNNWLRFIIDHNPCYLLSGAFMLLGCWLLNFALYTRAGDIQKLLLLLLVINLYEFLLIALGLVLIKHLAFRRDGRILLALEALFLVDVTFINGIISTIDFRIGLFINLVLLVLAAIKVRLILTRLRLPNSGRIATFILVQIAILFMVPTAYKWIATPRHGHIPTLAVYSTWWLTFLIPLIGLILHRLPTRRLDSAGREHSLAALFILISFASLLVHLYSAGWVYSIDFSPAFLSPLLLGLALAAILLEGPRLQRYLIARVQFCLIALSIYLSTTPVPFLHLSLSPLRLTLIASALLFLYFILLHDNLTFLWTAALCLCAALLGPSTGIMWQNLVRVSTSSRRLIPRTTLQWGIASVGASFALLLIGALLSFKKNVDLQRPTAQE